MMYDKKIVTELKALLVEKFSENIIKVILFGSRVEGSADEYSDYDILIILRNDYDWKYKYKVQDVCWEIDYKYDVLTDVKIISLNELNTLRGKQPYVLNALEKGVSI